MRFKVGDKITNGKVALTILTLASDRYVVEDAFGGCGTIYLNCQDGWKIVEEEMPLDKAGQITDFEYDGLAYTLPDGYQFVDENGNVINATKIVLEKKKKEYPKTYCECKDILGLWDIDDTECGYYKTDLIDKLQMLLICRDAYWKIAGEEMGLGKPWEPDWKKQDKKYIISVFEDTVIYFENEIYNHNTILAFPTAEMRDAFYENFKEEIEICKELL